MPVVLDQAIVRSDYPEMTPCIVQEDLGPRVGMLRCRPTRWKHGRRGL